MISSNCFGVGQPSAGADGNLKGLSRFGRRRADLAGGHLHVLLAKRRHHVVCGNLARGEAIGIEPQAHGVAALSEDDDVADAGDAAEFVLHKAIDVVADERDVVLAMLGVGAGGKHEVGRDFVDGDADLVHLGGQAARHLGNAVLNIHRREIEIARQIEGDRDGGGTVAAARRAHVLHPLDAVDRLLERRRDRGLDGLRAGPVVERQHLHLWRRQIGKLRDRQRRNRKSACQHDDQRADRGQDRPLDERLSEHARYCPTTIGAPSTSFCAPSTIRRSSAFSPSSTA